jgi:hypothetical protein
MAVQVRLGRHVGRVRLAAITADTCSPNVGMPPLFVMASGEVVSSDYSHNGEHPGASMSIERMPLAGHAGI